MTRRPSPTVWPVLHYDDTHRALRFLVQAFGFHEVLSVSDERGEIVHAELRWPAGGAAVFGSTKHEAHDAMRAATSASYVVTDDVDRVLQRAVGAGADVVNAPHVTAFGSGVKM